MALSYLIKKKNKKQKIYMDHKSIGPTVHWEMIHMHCLMGQESQEDLH